MNYRQRAWAGYVTLACFVSIAVIFTIARLTQ